MFTAPSTTLPSTASEQRSNWDAQAPLFGSQRLTQAAITGAACGLAFLAGIFVASRDARSYNHTRGACLALEFAENFGAVSPVQKRQALRALTTSASPERGLFPRTVTEVEEICAQSLVTSVRYGR